MTNLMPLVHQARRTLRSRQEGNRAGAKGSSTVYRIPGSDPRTS